MKAKKILAALGLMTVIGAAGAAHADVVIWINDTNNNLGAVNLTNHAASTFFGDTGAGQTLTDIGFTTNGNLYGVSFDRTYSINTTTGNATYLTSNPSNSDMNALVGYSATGLYGAAVDTTKLYAFNTSTNTWSTLSGSTGHDSAGDLALADGFYYESAINGITHNDELLKLTVSGGSVSSSVVGDFSLGAAHFDDVFGLAFDGSTMYAVNGTTIYSVDLTNAHLTSVYDYGGDVCTGSGFRKQCLGRANGAAILPTVGGAVPEPATWGLMIVGIGLMGSQLRLRRRAASAVA